MEMNKNLSLLFYVKEDAKKSAIEGCSYISELRSFEMSGDTIHDIEYQKYFANPLVTNGFTLTTTYPGLLIGSGYSHPALHEIGKKNKDDIGDFQLGFFFDHTTGLPVIPGSSVKGILKSVFPKKDFSFRNKKFEYIKELSEKVGIKKEVYDLIDDSNWEKIFFGEPPKRKHVFCDAYIECIPPDGRILEDDYITPHHNNIFKEPTPIRFLKIAPGIKITFQFVLHDYLFNDEMKITKDKIAQVFEQIILHFGIGAKRNVGYGQFQ